MLPRGWAWSTVRALGDVRLGRQRSPKNHQGAHVRPYLRVANVYEDRIEHVRRRRNELFARRVRALPPANPGCAPNEGQSLELVGRPAIYRGEVPRACFQNTLIRFRTDGPICAFQSSPLFVFRSYLRTQSLSEDCAVDHNIAHLGAERSPVWNSRSRRSPSSAASSPRSRSTCRTSTRRWRGWSGRESESSTIARCSQRQTRFGRRCGEAGWRMQPLANVASTA